MNYYDKHSSQGTQDHDITNVIQVSQFNDIPNLQKLLAQGEVSQTVKDLALQRAAFNGHLEVVRILLSLEKPANLHADDDYALQGAAANGHTGVVDLLLTHGADIHAKNDLALRWASEEGRTETVQLLLENGADIHAGHDHAIRFAAAKKHFETVSLLEKWKAAAEKNPAEQSNAVTAPVKNGFVNPRRRDIKPPAKPK